MAVLPILRFEDKIVETVEKNPVVVIIGETGSGKSTQLSQILHRRGYTRSGAIAITQPRRVAAVSLSRRVALEVGVQLGEEVGYAIRFEDRTSAKTCIKYLTDGVLLRESLSNPELNQYSVIILDEVHERSLNSDIILGLMKRLVKIRSSNLRVLITSATLDGVKVSKFFSGCPVMNIPGKLFPVEKLYSSERPKCYIESSLRTALDIHSREPPGDILIFMTGKDDIDKMVSKLEEKIQNLDEGSCMDAQVLSLHGSLPPEMQVRVFSPAHPNCRRIIVATNIAETSLTVDGVVVQADQRAGRAGRTRPGKCYRLYPSKVYHEEFLDATVPEIQRSSLAGSVLYLKSLNLPDIDILNFDFLDPPSRESLADALRQLYLIDAIDEDGMITHVGRTMAELPLEPSLSRTLIEANELGCLSQALTVVAMLSAEITHLSIHSIKDKKRKQPLKLPSGSYWGDHIHLLRIYENWDCADYDPAWCTEHNLQVRNMKFSRDVRKQLSQIMQKISKGPVDIQSSVRQKKGEQEYRSLRKALCRGFGNQLAERMLHHNGFRTLGYRSQLVQVHPSSMLETNEDGRLPDYVVYHELISTSRPFMRNVCAVDISWVAPILKKLEKMDIHKLSGGLESEKIEQAEHKQLQLHNLEESGSGRGDSMESRIQAARERYLARKANK
ncbi:probable pre-mRNA-splicing factor ATP-dependent RNA helicase DEAH4 isoform X2 [Phalaenopsis equestris]|uniref:probable pre-mRNA-splicing factor ATP-dependent RNA helicase DEAH4 isoform X2 n=1 Tax=Phalaenopsis equestris TaxID=78828 RepID=UPI0009E2E458|nr:probable pre-mRNA-splicing factor ATP-dependent RNA helicase DEAH4 isoform X2 [Phalaenopsis equestris]